MYLYDGVVFIRGCNAPYIGSILAPFFYAVHHGFILRESDSAGLCCPEKNPVQGFGIVRGIGVHRDLRFSSGGDMLSVLECSGLAVMAFSRAGTSLSLTLK